jgi:hypothetical protein
MLTSESSSFCSYSLKLHAKGRIHYADFESSSFCSYSLKLHAKGRIHYADFRVEQFLLLFLEAAC